MADISASPHFVLDNTFGAAFVGLVVAATLHGVSCVQAWYYFTHQDDQWPIRLLVGAVMAFDTIHQILITHTVYIYTISNWGNSKILGRLVWSMLVEVLFNGFTAFLVQSFLAMRVWRLSNRNPWLTLLVCLLIAGEFGAPFVHITFWVFAHAACNSGCSLSIIVNALAAAGDVLIAGTLCIILHRSRTGFHRSDTMINKLILFSVNTGVLTSLCAIASLISIVVAGHTFLYIAFFFCIGRLYSNSLLATLNARKMIRGAADGIHSTSTCENMSLKSFSHNAKSKTGGVSSAAARRQANISIKIDTTKEFATDSDPENDTEKHSVVMMTPTCMTHGCLELEKGGNVA
ncbi:hypothetical protein K443DRAFT_96699 [Laccaria amethystina LaAM-08-1]|uniref:DUF6534 domain-containing protein n=1 Tax=Laccaria amethystina LaAM-08-1 TaxID=1095629 RepID=A0A0C9XCH2_9AGAR|nr:hypothetical protein K443DRAFT_96699 [Laccaria amethystina LaAM-08-1]